MINSAFTDEDLHGSLIWASEGGSSFLQTISTAAFIADTPSYILLRPALLKLTELHQQG
jgi:hypothetical protein